MMATKLSDDQRLLKAVCIHLKRMNPGVKVRKSKEPWLDWQAMQTVDQPHLREDAYLHRSCKPLPLVDFESLEDKGQQNWPNECEGMCGV